MRVDANSEPQREQLLVEIPMQKSEHLLHLIPILRRAHKKVKTLR